ncbi:MAG: ABC transporter ATP-binding protein, partial [Candidatus Limnocylindrales bacterium]
MPAGSTVATPSPETAPLILRLSDIHTYYGHIHALQGISLEVHKGEIVTLLGANG